MSAYEPYPTSAASDAPLPSAVPAAPLASRGRRFAAVAIDVLIVWVPAMAIAVVLGLVLSADAATETEEEDIVAGVFILVIVATTALYLFAYLCPLLGRAGARNGQTLGKQWMGVRVVTATGAPVTYGCAVKRELLGTWVPNLITGIYSLFDYGWGLFDDRRTCLHDKIASTYVIRADAPFATGQPLYPPAHGYAPPPAPPRYGQQPWGQPAQPPAQPPQAQPPQQAAAEAPRHRWAPPSSPPSPPRSTDDEAARLAFGDRG